MALKVNIIANYIGTGYNLLIGIVILPLYLGYMGAEAYGLVGFFTLMQVWLNILDLGLSPTLNRQAAAASSSPNGYQHFVSLLKSFELIFFFLALVTVSLVYIGSEWMSHHWFDAQILTPEDVQHSVQLMGVIIALRWQTALYRSGILGFEYHVWNNMVSVTYASFRFIGSLLLVMFVSNDILHFFYYQLFLSAIEFLVLRHKLYRILPANIDKRLQIDIPAVRKVAPFALGVAYSASLWVIVTQLDKLMLSTLLPLTQFGYFSLVTVISSGLLHITFPVSVAIQPRLTALLAEGKIAEMQQLYRSATRFVAFMSGAVVVVMVVYSEPLLYAWTGDREAAKWGAPVLVWFALGNAMLTLGTFQYFLQFAFGSMRLHVIGSTISAVLQVPIILYAAIYYGAVGAGLAWFGFRCIFFLIWPPIVHNRFAPGLHSRWLLIDIVPCIVITVLLIILWQMMLPLAVDNERFNIMLHIGMVAMLTLALMFLPLFVFSRWRRKRTDLLPLASGTVRDEQEILSQWLDVELKVSICCICHNQEKYLAQALDSFLQQKTDFAFEIVVHDDASTDGSSDIIRQYANRYPRLIKPVFQTENQYRQGRQISANFVWPKARGKYLALCEGDDFWCDSSKLARQIAVLERMPDVDICFHPSIELYPDGKQIQACNMGNKARIIDFAQVVRGGGGFIPTAAIVVRRVVVQQLPAWFQNVPVGDYYLQMLAAKRGGAAYLPQVMCCYRREADNSWSISTQHWSEHKIAKVSQAHIKVLTQFQAECAAEFASDLNYAKAREVMLTAIIAIKARNFVLAKQLVEQSWQHRRFAGTRQTLLYSLRSQLKLLFTLRFILSKSKQGLSNV
ncbi:glycosyltransferase [Rheinheimera maricola]|uniref:Glycosyltransferase n=1 Tax=Rheinheimera maricola TaxID=2793282 RepID=A0ABS7X414_9GAMM|nr:glycosyltransferase [Rheinheimera maricola]MBZ9610294.1 glycosyltransferase [Rheinheimera maricola]